MTHSRRFLESLWSSVLASPLLSRTVLAQTPATTRAAGLSDAGDPAYWENVRKMWTRGWLRQRSSGATGLRRCTHVFNSPAEIDRALAIVQAL
jgi:hypothetical protein